MKVTIVNDKIENKSLLIQWLDAAGTVHKGYIPDSLVNRDGSLSYINDDDLTLVVPYGCDWEYLLQNMSEVTPELIANNLRKRNIWTASDLRSKPQVAIKAIMDSYGVTLSNLYILLEKSDGGC